MLVIKEQGRFSNILGFTNRHTKTATFVYALDTLNYYAEKQSLDLHVDTILLAGGEYCLQFEAKAENKKGFRGYVKHSNENGWYICFLD